MHALDVYLLHGPTAGGARARCRKRIPKKDYVTQYLTDLSVYCIIVHTIIFYVFPHPRLAFTKKY